MSQSLLKRTGIGIGVISGIAACGMWLWALTAPAPSVPFDGSSVAVAILMLFAAICVVIASIKGHGIFLMVLFFASFFPIGAYLIGVPHWLRGIAIADLGFLAAGLLIWRAGKAADRE